jgi:threonyl-tRNA synthetase
MVVDYGAMEVETPIMYDYGHPALSKYLHRFPARQYVVKSDEKEYFLRFAACFGQYMIQRDMVTSYRDLPMRLYELTHFSFRREQSGEVAGLRRLRAFTMPDMHTLVRDVAMAKEEFVRQMVLCLRWLDDVGLECVPAIRFVRSFLDENPRFVEQIMRTLGRPALVEVWDQRFFYFVAKFEMNFVDTAKKAACLSTVQIDVENSERFDINYIGEDGTKQRPLLMHTSVSGSVDRNVYAILENQAMRVARGEKAFFPVWLAPIQVRILPVSEPHIKGALQLAERIPYRVDVDDRDLKVGRKIRESEMEWVPYALVVGEKELSGGTLTVRPRLGGQTEMPLDAFLERLAAEMTGKPMLAANTPRLLSRRPTFVG